MKKARKKSSRSSLRCIARGATGYGQLDAEIKPIVGRNTARGCRSIARTLEQWVIQLRYAAGMLDGRCLGPDAASLPLESKCTDRSAWWKLVANWSTLSPERRVYLADVFEAWVGMIRCWVQIAPRRQTPPLLFVEMDRLSKARLN
jgi:hypothetical protein